jgi:hypothetical protein
VIGAVLVVSSCAPIGVNGEVLGEFSCHPGALSNPDGAWPRLSRTVHPGGEAAAVAGSPADPCGWLGGELLSTPNFVIKLDTLRRDDRHPSRSGSLITSTSVKAAHPRLSTLTYASNRFGTLWTKRQLTSFSLRLAGLITARSE